MYSSCIFCNSALGRNDALEIFPVGRRLAFDSALGRLWVVCRSCGRWNLSPVEERWEVIEQCERLFRDTRVRVSTEQIGLARLPEGLELVRIGKPQRPEFAAWRYGDQFGRRRMRSLGLAAAGVAGVGALYFGGIVGGGLFTTWMMWSLTRNAVRGNPDKVIAQVRHQGKSIKVRRKQLEQVHFEPEGFHDWNLVIPISETRVGVLHGPEAVRVAGQLLPAVNRYGGTRTEVQAAVGELERVLHPERYFAHVASERRFASTALPKLPGIVRLAIEMAAHEESERRALEGELAELERAWQQAEEIAAISDSLLLPDNVVNAYRRLRGG